MRQKSSGHVDWTQDATACKREMKRSDIKLQHVEWLSVPLWGCSWKAQVSLHRYVQRDVQTSSVGSQQDGNFKVIRRIWGNVSSGAASPPLHRQARDWKADAALELV